MSPVPLSIRLREAGGELSKLKEGERSRCRLLLAGPDCDLAFRGGWVGELLPGMLEGGTEVPRWEPWEVAITNVLL